MEDINFAELGREKRDCEEKLRRETDEEAKRALDYQLKQVTNKINNYLKESITEDIIYNEDNTNDE